MNKERLQIFSILFAGLIICAAMILSEQLAPPLVEVQVAEASNPASVGTEPAKLDLNTASLSELMTIQGIGAVTAQRILDYRTMYGSFQYLEELMNVRGIGAGKYETLKNFLTV